MDIDTRYELYEKIYFNELDEMNKILSRFTVLIAGTALILNAYIFIIGYKDFSNLPQSLKLLFISSMFFCMSLLLFFMYRTFAPLKYHTISILTELEAKRTEFCLHELEQRVWNSNEENTQKINVNSADELFKDDLIRCFIEYSSYNRGLNNQRRAYFSKTLNCICVNFGLCLVMLASLLFVGVY